MTIKIKFNKKEIEKFMKENQYGIPQLSYHSGLSVKLVRQMLDDALYIDQKFIKSISLQKGGKSKQTITQ